MAEFVFDESAIRDCTVAPPLDDHGQPPQPRIGEIHTEVVEVSEAAAERFRQQMAEAVARSETNPWVPGGLRHSEFEIGDTFTCAEFYFWRCTDVGTRAITATPIDKSGESRVDFGPDVPQAAEHLFDEYDLEGCALALQIDDDVLDWLRKKGLGSVKAFRAALEALLQDAPKHEDYEKEVSP